VCAKDQNPILNEFLHLALEFHPSGGAFEQPETSERQHRFGAFQEQFSPKLSSERYIQGTLMKKCPKNNGGERGIRTPGTAFDRTTV
jgi:hypothetical protein